MTRILASLCLCAAGLGAQPNDWTIVPGERIGPITGSSTIVSLRQQFGAANVREAELPTAKPDRGFAYGLENGPAAIVYPESPSRALAVYWGKGETAGHPRVVRVCYEDPSIRRAPHPEETGRPCQWKTREGITLGTTLAELERLNGRPFTMGDFAWMYGGFVESWNGGRLEPLETGSVILELNLIEIPLELRKPESGALSLSSDVPAAQALKIRVAALAVTFPR
jgi:hypothetical protein